MVDIIKLKAPTITAAPPPKPSGPNGEVPAPAKAPDNFKSNIGKDARGYASLLDKPEYGAYKLEPSKLSDWAPITILLEGEKNASKSCLAAGLPNPYGGKTIFITADNTTLDGLANYYFPRRMPVGGVEKEVWDYHFANDIKAGKLIVYEVAKRKFDPKTGKETWPGYDPNRPWTAELVFAKAMRLLEEHEKANDADVVVIDHFQEFYESIIKSVIMFHNNLDPAFGKISIGNWEERTRLMTLLEYKARSVARFASVITGYGEEEKNIVQPDLDENGQQKLDSKGKGKIKVTKENRMPSWVNKFQRNYIVVMHLSSFKEIEGKRGPVARERDDDAAKTTFLAEIRMSKRRRFPQGKTFDMTFKTLGTFWENSDPTLDQPVSDEGESTTATVVDVPQKEVKETELEALSKAIVTSTPTTEELGKALSGTTVKPEGA